MSIDRNELREIVAGALGKKPADIDMNADLYEDLQMSPAQAQKIVIEMLSYYDYKISKGELKNIGTINRLADELENIW